MVYICIGIAVTALYYHGAENINHKVNLTKKPGAAGLEVVDRLSFKLRTPRSLTVITCMITLGVL